MPSGSKLKYSQAHYARIEFSVPKESKPKLVEYAKSNGFDSFQTFIAYCLEKETGIPCRLEGSLPWIGSKNKRWLDEANDS